MTTFRKDPTIRPSTAHQPMKSASDVSGSMAAILRFVRTGDQPTRRLRIGELARTRAERQRVPARARAHARSHRPNLSAGLGRPGEVDEVERGRLPGGPRRHAEPPPPCGSVRAPRPARDAFEAAPARAARTRRGSRSPRSPRRRRPPPGGCPTRRRCAPPPGGPRSRRRARGGPRGGSGPARRRGCPAGGPGAPEARVPPPRRRGEALAAAADGTQDPHTTAGGQDQRRVDARLPLDDEVATGHQDGPGRILLDRAVEPLRQARSRGGCRDGLVR